MVDLVAFVLFGSIVCYAVMGGTDFGAGFWDLTAGGSERGERRRALIDDAMGPVWEANHVWLVFSLIVLWTAFSEAFASIMLTLFVPITLAALGIVLRGSGFAFRKVVSGPALKRFFGIVFATSSVIVPFFLGATAGGIASGRVPPGGTAGDPWDSWLNATSLVGGLLAVAACIYLSAVWLGANARRLDEPDLVSDFRRRAIVAAIAVGVVEAVGLIVTREDSAYLWSNLTGGALPLIVLSAVIGIGAIVMLVRGSTVMARVLAVGAVSALVWSWGVAQFPYLLPTSLTLDAAAAPSGTLWAVLVVAVLVLVICVPSLVMLYALEKRGLLEPAAVASTSQGDLGTFEAP